MRAWSLIMDERFDSFFDLLMQLEGGYVNNKNDRGGETNFGITSKAYGKSVENITKYDAKKFYYKNYYSLVKFVENTEFHYNYFDVCVNSGYKTYKILLNKNFENIKDLYKWRKEFFEDLAKKQNQSEFLVGWLNRIKKIGSYFDDV